MPRFDGDVRVWLSSEFIDPTEYVRFAPSLPVYEAARWPLGIIPGQNSEQRVVMAGMCDDDFDWQVRCALQLPQRYSGLGFGPPPRRDRADLWIRHVGHWDGAEQRLAEIIASLGRRPGNRHPDFSYFTHYALTPFAIIGQTWCQPDAATAAFMVDTTIAFFYGGDSLIQECLITEGLTAGAARADLLAAYDHRYSWVAGTSPLLVDDPCSLSLRNYGPPATDLARLALPSLMTLQDERGSHWEARSGRKFLFDSRVQTHLMVAIAAACHGLANFASGQIRSPLVRALTDPPHLDTLKPHWLGHVLRDYDHATACADLLESLAGVYEQDLTSDHLRGMPIPPYRSSSDPIQQSIIETRPHLGGCTVDHAIDAFRWNLFDIGIDDVSVIRWAREAIGWVENWPQYR
ncbi:hypothetical protein ACQR0Z_18640 [Bradyrhizobium sp. HKCCYLS3077]|uniref:hypothetical protein n=1 Tax=Bradyrhizobium sp. HKCCYLS3077 TaxID=3420761 RepID=UPI003EBA951C